MSNLFTLFGTIAVNADSANRTIDSTTRNAEHAGSRMGNAFNKIGSFAVSCGKVVASGLAVGAAAIGALMKGSLESFAEYEQLVGGIETLFKDSKQKVMEYANEAYKTAGMSANEYMDTVTSFSASLLQGLGGDTERAADYANMAITDMSDNANKMGTDISMIQNAYQGFAKQNYTMLDNLKLGYGGTAEEMARLVNDSGVLGAAITVDAKSLKQVPFHKIIDAINVIQDRMGIAGTTLAEATDTISGSFSALGATWTNLLTGLASGDQDIDELVDNFIEAGGNLASNVFKVLPRLMKNIGKAASKLMQSVGQKLNEVWTGSVWPWLQETLKAKLGIDLPSWSEVTSTITSWWKTAQRTFDQVCKWTLNLFENPHETALEIGEAISSWWKNTALPAVKSASTWALNLFGVPIEDDATIIEHIGGWWKAAGSLVYDACSWVLQLFGVPEEDADTITSTVEGWWKGAVDNVTNACHWLLKFFGVTPWTEDDTRTVEEWWKGAGTSATAVLKWALGIPTTPDETDTLKEIEKWWKEKIKGAAELITKLSVSVILPSLDAVVEWFASVLDKLFPGLGAVETYGDIKSGEAYKNELFSSSIAAFTGAGLYTGESPNVEAGAEASSSGLMHGGGAGKSFGAEGFTMTHGGGADKSFGADANDIAAAVRDAVAGIQFSVMLDTGVLVGQLAPQMDASLGALAGRKGRRN